MYNKTSVSASLALLALAATPLVGGASAIDQNLNEALVAGAGEHVALLATDPTGMSAFPIPEGATFDVSREGDANTLRFLAADGSVLRSATFRTAVAPVWSKGIMADVPAAPSDSAGTAADITTACKPSGTGEYCATTIVNSNTVYHQISLYYVEYTAYYLYSCDYWYSCTKHLETRWSGPSESYVSSHCVPHVGTQTVYSQAQKWGGAAVNDAGTYIWAGRSC